MYGTWDADATDNMMQLSQRYLNALTAHPDRRVGGPGNQAATELCATELERCGLHVERVRFECIDWEYGEASIEVGGETYAAHPGPYSLPCDVEAPFVAIETIEQLESDVVTGAVLLLHGQIASGQVMPKNFTFYNPDSHKRIVRALEDRRPAAVFAATGRDPELVGSQYPFPLFEDGDLDVPTAYLTDVEGERLVRHAGTVVRARIDSRRIPSWGEQVIATKRGTGESKIVVTAHVDSRQDSPGALDNATGVIVLLLLARMLDDYSGSPSIEIVPFNGEDNYANPGEMVWIARNSDAMEAVEFNLNIDDSGMRDAISHVSFYGCPPDIERAARAAMRPCARVEEGPQWFQSDHAIFSAYGRPAMAIASSEMGRFMAEYAHTDRDTGELVDHGLVVETARFVRELVRLTAGET